jgi:hypothetical protein
MRRHSHWLVAVPLLFGLAGLAACRDKAAAPAATDSSSSAATAQAPAGSAEAAAPSPQVPPLPAHPSALPVTAGQAAPEQGSLAPPVPAQPSSLVFDLPAGWKSMTPDSAMRLAQATIAGPGGPAELGVFFFGQGQGGSPEANIERWSGQMTGGAKPRQGSLTAHGLKVTWVDVTGTMKPSAMGMGPSTEQANYRLLGAVVEGPGGPWFFKATGPDATLGPQRDAFLKMLGTVRLQQGQQI